MNSTIKTNDYVLVSQKLGRCEKEICLGKVLSAYDILVYSAYGAARVMRWNELNIHGKVVDIEVLKEYEEALAKARLQNNRTMLMANKPVKITKVIENGVAKIFFFSDGDKVVVKRHMKDKEDFEKAVAVAIAKKWAKKNQSSFYSCMEDAKKILTHGRI